MDPVISNDNNINSSSDNTDDTNKQSKDDTQNSKGSFIYMIVLLIWVMLGLMAYISAFQCTHERYTGGDARKIGMLLLAFMLGPFYWFIQPTVRKNGYCNLK
jgi:hypothetical protein